MSSRARPLLDLDPTAVRRARSLARRAGKPVVDLARSHTTVSVERATLRLAGLSGADHENVPWVNHLVDAVRDGVGLEHGVTTPVWDALRRGEAPDLLTLAQKSASGAVTFRLPEGKDATAGRKAARSSVARGGVTALGVRGQGCCDVQPLAGLVVLDGGAQRGPRVEGGHR